MPRPLSPWLPDIAASGPNLILGGSFRLSGFAMDAGLWQQKLWVNKTGGAAVAVASMCVVSVSLFPL